jgi:hypothetical protein
MVTQPRWLNAFYTMCVCDMQLLDRCKSTYNTPFAKLCKEMFISRAEANDNHRYDDSSPVLHTSMRQHSQRLSAAYNARARCARRCS